MADKKISELDVIGALTGSNPIFPLVQGGNTLQINASALAVYTSQWSATTASFNTFVSTQNAVNLGIAIVTGSFNQFTASLNTTYATDDQLLQLYQATASIQLATASINTSITSLNSFSSSIRTEVGNIEAYTASLKSSAIVSSSQQILNYNIFVTTSSLNTYTSSQNLVNLGISIVTGSLNSQTSSQNSVNLGISIVTGSLNTFTSSQDLVNLGISIVTGSLNQQTASQDSVNLGISEVTSSLNSYTSSNESWKNGVRGEVNGLEAYTASLKGAIEVNGQDVNVLGMLTAQQFNVTYVSSSTMYQSGSTKFGDTSDDRHEFTGSVDISDSLVVQSGASGSFSGSFEGYVYTSKNGVAETTLEGDVINVKSLNDSYVASFPRFRVESYDTTKFGYFQLQPWNGEVYIVSNDGLNLESNTGRVKVTGSLFVNDSVEAVNLTGSLLSTNGVVSSSNQLFELNEQTGSQDLVNLGISTFTGSIREEVGGIEAYTASLKAATIVSSSTQIQNYNVFAQTASVNTFYGNQFITGTLDVRDGITGSFKGNINGTANLATNASQIALLRDNTDTTLYPIFSANIAGDTYSTLRGHTSGTLYYNGLTQQLIVSGGGLVVTGSTNLTGSVTINESRIDDAWTSYVPTWTAASSNPTIGNGTITAAYKVIGKTCFVRGRILFGSTTDAGSGAWYIGLPVSAASPYGIQMPASILDNGNNWYSAQFNGGRAGFSDKSEIQYQGAGGTAAGVGSTVPMTWGDLDEIAWNGSYEIA